MKKKIKDISIVGGGISGCVSAFLLSRKGYNVTLFEKKNTLGGSTRDIIDKNNVFFNGPHYFDEKSFWFKELKKLNIFKNYFYNFSGSYKNKEKYHNINKVYCDIFGESLIHNNFPHPVTKNKFTKLKNFIDLDTLENRIDIYQSNIQKPLKKWCKNFTNTLNNLNGDCSSILSISRIFFQKDIKKITKLKVKNKNADMLLGVPKIDYKGRYFVPKKGYDIFFSKFTKILKKDVKIFLNSKIDIKIDNSQNLSLYNKSKLIQNDKIIWACNPVPLIREFGIDPLDNEVLKVKIFSSNVTFLNKSYKKNFYIQVFSKNTNIFRIYFYKINNRSKISIETFFNKEQSKLDVVFLKTILDKFKIDIKIDTVFCEKKEIRHVLVTSNDLNKFKNFEKKIINSNIITGGWHLFSREKKINHIINKLDFYE